QNDSLPELVLLPSPPPCADRAPKKISRFDGNQSCGYFNFVGGCSLRSWRALRLKAFAFGNRKDLSTHELLSELLPFGYALLKLGPTLLEFMRHAGGLFSADEILQRSLAGRNYLFQPANLHFQFHASIFH